MAETDVCQIRYDPDARCVVMVWQGYATSAEFRAANERVLAAIYAHRVENLLGDVSRFVLIGATDQNWLNDNWIPRAIDAGLRRVALVQPTYYFNQVAVENVGRRLDANRLQLSYFGDMASARDWLTMGADK
jgi:hypothetical protein